MAEKKPQRARTPQLGEVLKAFRDVDVVIKCGGVSVTARVISLQVETNKLFGIGWLAGSFVSVGAPKFYKTPKKRK